MDTGEKSLDSGHESLQESGKVNDRYFAYVYRDPRTLQVLYAGYGTQPGRAYSVGHNQKIVTTVESGEGFEIMLAGPYRDEMEARNVESALVSALSPNFNLIEQPGLKFRHLGVPEELGSRRTEPALSIHEVGRRAGGALIVYCNLTTELKSGEEKLSPTNFSDEVILNNIRDHWMVKKFIPGWVERPETSPKALVAVQGPVKDRIIVASCLIDSTLWASTPSAPWDKHVHRVPLQPEAGLDIGGIRGRRIDVKFNSGPPNYIMWVDDDGLVLHGYRVTGTRG
jgi:hypothetical protein